MPTQLFEFNKRVRSFNVFNSYRLTAMYVGEADPKEIDRAKKKAFTEALESAKELAELAGIPLGKLVALTPESNGGWRYSTGLSYADRMGKNSDSAALSCFSPKEFEVFGTNLEKLSRSYTIELRFSLE